MADPILPAGAPTAQATQVRINDLEQVTAENMSLSQVMAVDFPTQTLKMTLQQLLEFAKPWLDLDLDFARLDGGNQPFTGSITASFDSTASPAVPAITVLDTALGSVGGFAFASVGVTGTGYLQQTDIGGNTEKSSITMEKSGAVLLGHDGIIKTQTTPSGTSTTGDIWCSGAFNSSQAGASNLKVLDWSGMGIAAWVSVNSDGAILLGRGVVSCVRESAGLYLLTLARDVSTNTAVYGGLKGLAGALSIMGFNMISGTQCRVAIEDDGLGDRLFSAMFIGV